MLTEKTAVRQLKRKRCSVGVFFVAAKDSWRVRWRDPVSGKFVTKHWPKAEKGKALAFAQGRKWEERDWGADAVSNAERILLARLREAAARHGRTVDAVLPELLEVVERRAITAISPGEALERFLASCQARNLRPASIDTYEKVCREFLARTKLARMSGATAGFLRSYILARHKSEGSRQKVKRHLLAWVRWCGTEGLHAGQDLEAVTWPAVRSDSRRILSLSPGEARALLGELLPRHRAACALGLFAGVRPEELRRLTWEDVHPERRIIHIPGSAAKIREARTLRALPENLWAWLEAHPGERKGPVVPITMANWLLALRKARARAKVRTWGVDILRKTFASYGFHLPGGPTQAAEIMGHLRGLQVYLRHYRDLRSAEEAREFFAVVPEAE